MRATVSFPYDIVHLPRHILYLEAMPEGSEHSYQNGFGGGLDRGDRGDRAGRGGTQTSAAAGFSTACPRMMTTRKWPCSAAC